MYDDMLIRWIGDKFEWFGGGCIDGCYGQDECGYNVNYSCNFKYWWNMVYVMLFYRY